MTASISIPSPDFALGAEVLLHYQGAVIPTSIRVRHYDPDCSTWFYRVAMSGQWHTANEFSDRPGEAV